MPVVLPLEQIVNIYQPLINSNYTIACPTLVDLWEEPQRQREPHAQQLALVLQLFATGSMKTFAQPQTGKVYKRIRTKPGECD